MNHPATKASIRIAIIAALLLGLLVATQTALGHSAKFYPRIYSPDAFTVDVYFNRDVPGGATRSRILNGAETWNAEGRQVVFMGHRRAVNYGDDRCSELPAQTGVVDWRPIDAADTTLAVNIRCRYMKGPRQGYLRGFRQIYDSGEPWYRGTGKTPNGRYDLWSLASHEFGHATGFSGHFKKDSPECAKLVRDPDTGQLVKNLDRQTMCPKVPAGTEFWRTLGSHDKHTFARVYP